MDKFHEPQMVALTPPTYVLRVWIKACTYAWIWNMGRQCLPNDSKVQEMDLWSMIPIGVHQYTILSTMVSSISLGNILWKDTTCKNLLGNESYLMISFHHSTLQLAYTTQAWMWKFKTYVMQANIWNAHSNAPYKFMSLLPLLVCLKF